MLTEELELKVSELLRLTQEKEYSILVFEKKHGIPEQFDRSHFMQIGAGEKSLVRRDPFFNKYERVGASHYFSRPLVRNRRRLLR